MQLETRRFGTIEVKDDDAFAVPTGIPGFPAMRRVALLGAGPAPGQEPDDEQALFWLQDLDDGDLAFLCVVPWIAFPEYEIDIDERSLGIDDELDVRILGIITVRQEDEGESMTVNLRAPLVVDVAKRRLQQVILSDSRWPIRAPFAVLTNAEVS
ncbi:MAG: hypothetical protein RLZZ362_463 [Actinomycetota bacterium]